MGDNPAPMIMAVIASTVWLIAAYFLANSPAMAARRVRGEQGDTRPESGFEAGARSRAIPPRTHGGWRRSCHATDSGPADPF